MIDPDHCTICDTIICEDCEVLDSFERGQYSTECNKEAEQLIRRVM